MNKHRNALGWYSVLSPVYSYIEPVTDDGAGPREDARDWLAVQAYTKSEAKAIAVRKWLKDRAGYLDDYPNPYSGVTVEPMVKEDADDTSESCYVPYDHNRDAMLEYKALRAYYAEAEI